ncbi:MAG TPA: hypothetical protein VN713_10185 [Sphingomicrobium sp.]|nr:hypothetical protein [Sphingomicrobium sp.]
MFCNQCGQRIADDSRFCKFCGSSQSEQPSQTAISKRADPAPSRAKDNTAKIIAGVGVAILLVIILASLGSGPNSASSPDANSASAAAVMSNSSDAGATQPAQAADNWSYSTDTDQVRGGTTYYATTTSTNSIHQDFPYSPETTMTLTVRKSPAYGTDVLLQISSGQMMCPSYEGCSGTIRFDSSPPQAIEFNGPTDSSSEVVFVRNASSFLAKLKKAKKLVVEKTLYEAGAPQFEFNVAGLKWEH